jgi:hypothetical protein
MASSRAAEALVVATLLAAACAEGNAAGSRPDAAATRPDAALGREAAPGSRSGREQAACAPAASGRDAGATPECAACVDRELAARGLNQFGDPPDAMYAGGTPLFDERTGKATDRVEYVLSHHQAIAAACGAIESPGRPTGG